MCSIESSTDIPNFILNTNAVTSSLDDDDNTNIVFLHLLVPILFRSRAQMSGNQFTVEMKIPLNMLEAENPLKMPTSACRVVLSMRAPSKDQLVYQASIESRRRRRCCRRRLIRTVQQQHAAKHLCVIHLRRSIARRHFKRPSSF